MSHPEKPSVKLKLAGVDYQLVYDFNSIADAEEIVDRPLITGLRSRDITTPTVGLVRAMFYATARTSHPELTYEHAKSLITKKTLPEVWGKVLEAWALAQAEPEKESDGNPPQDQS
jgi:hypothetical protein